MQKVLSVQILSAAAVLGVDGHLSNLRGSDTGLKKKGFDYICNLKGKRRTLCRTVLAIDESQTDEARSFLDRYSGIGKQGSGLPYPTDGEWSSKDVTRQFTLPNFFGSNPTDGYWSQFVAKSQQEGNPYNEYFNGCEIEVVDIWDDEPLARCSVVDVQWDETDRFHILQEIYTIGSVWDQVKWFWDFNYANDEVSYTCRDPHDLSGFSGWAITTNGWTFWAASQGKNFQCDLCDYYPSAKGCSKLQLSTKVYPTVPMVKRMFKTDCKIGYETINLCTSVFYTGKYESLTARLNYQYGASYGYSPLIKDYVTYIEAKLIDDGKSGLTGLHSLCTTTEELNVPDDAPLAQCGFIGKGQIKVEDDVAGMPKIDDMESIWVFQEIGNKFGLIGETEKYVHRLISEKNTDGKFEIKHYCVPTVSIEPQLYTAGTSRWMRFGKAHTLSNCDASVYFKKP